MHAELDLTDDAAVGRFFEHERPEYVVLAAARVGGILANNTYPADFIRDNLDIQNSVIEASYRNGVERLLFLGSSCIYPKLCSQPIREEYLLTGPLEFDEQIVLHWRRLRVWRCAGATTGNMERGIWRRCLRI